MGKLVSTIARLLTDRKEITQNKRDHQRVDVRELNIEAIIDTNLQRCHIGKLVNLSCSGALVHYPIELHPGTEYPWALSGRKYKITGTVVYSCFNTKGGYMIGVQFKAPIHDIKIIKEYGL